MARADQPHKLTFDAFVAKVTNLDDPINAKHAELDYSRPETRAAWNGSKSKIPIWCNVHQNFFVQQAANHMVLGQGCPPCGRDLRTRKRTKADPIADFRRVHGETYDYSEVVYVNTHTPVTIICQAHGPFDQKPGAHLSGHGCPVCWTERRTALGAARGADFRATFAERAARVHQGAYALLSLPAEAHDVVKLNCPRHGDFEQKAYSHLAGHGCPVCGRVTSYTQREVGAFIESLGVRTEQDNRTVLGGLHIDIWAPDRRIGVEYHGSFWHTQARVGTKHREKYERAVAAGVRLVQVFDFEWLERRPAVENRLRALFGAAERVAARDCQLRAVDPAEVRPFLKEHHTQGAARATIVYALYVDGGVVAVMTFAPSRYSALGWELLRYASRGRVQGGFSRLLKAFLREQKPEQIISYCDLRWGDGAVYAASGFSLDGVTAPDYWYVTSNGSKVSRYSAQHRPAGQSEKAWAAEQGYEKVLGVGHQRWVWKGPEAA